MPCLSSSSNRGEFFELRPQLHFCTKDTATLRRRLTERVIDRAAHLAFVPYSPRHCSFGTHLIARLEKGCGTTYAFTDWRTGSTVAWLCSNLKVDSAFEEFSLKTFMLLALPALLSPSLPLYLSLSLCRILSPECCVASIGRYLRSLRECGRRQRQSRASGNACTGLEAQPRSLPPR